MTQSRTLRLAAGALAVVLPFGAAVGCGVQKRMTIKAELSSARDHLEASKAMAFTLRLDDAQGNAQKQALKDKSAPAALVRALLKGSITCQASTADDAAFRSLSSLTSPTDLKSALTKVNLAFIVRDDQATIGEIRLVAGVLYAQVNLNEIGRLAEAGGVHDFNSKVNQTVGQPGSPFAPVLADVRAGKWLKLPLAPYLDQLQKMATSIRPDLASPAPGVKADLKALGGKLFDAVKPYVKVTDANDSSTDRVLNVDVKVRPALKAMLSVLSTEKSLPFGKLFSGASDKIDSNVTDGTAHGTITLRSGHLSQVAVDIDSLRMLDPHADNISLAGVRLVVDINDAAAAVTAPTNVSSFDLGAVISQLLSARTQRGSFSSTITPSQG